LVADFASSACILSILRLHTLKVAVETTDPTWDDRAAAIWQILELNTRNVCSCLPTLRPLVTRIVTKLGTVNTGTRTQRLTVPLRVGVDNSGENLCSRIVEERIRSYNIHGLPLIGVGAHYLALVYTRL
jgi:hypothetical protein